MSLYYRKADSTKKVGCIMPSTYSSSRVTYDNSSSSLSATDLGAAITEIAQRKKVSAKIIITSDSGSVITVTSPSGAILPIKEVSGASNKWECSTNEYGVHTIVLTLEGDTFTITLDVDTCKVYNIKKSDFPIGKTVLPINDIQIWLHCASIYNKPYTLLSEVLADTDTLSFLMSIDNAVDYLIRSTTWIADICSDQNAMSYIGLNNYCANTLLANNTWLDSICNSVFFESVLNVKVPAMTSDTTPSGQVFYSSQYNTTTAAGYMAFDGTGSQWVAGPNQTNNTCGYIFPSAQKIKKAYVVTYTGKSASSYSPNASIQASNDGTTWVDLITNFQAFSTTDERAVTTNLAINNNMAYTQYRIFVPSVMYIANGHLKRVNMQFYGREDI